ncbi:MAG TPA: NAD-dependent epimerase/dehydratase family protein [Saprospiraceae bacterium]|nr:NAD-dependent epimerase/dehydratase family protein [Saprospiraceae bacterium]
MKIALTGMTGHLGSAVLRELHVRNYTVKALVRNENRPGFTSIPVDQVVGDILKRDTLVPLMQDCDALIHAAAVISINGDPEGIVHRTNVEGTRNVMEIAKQCGVKRVIHISSIHAYKQTPMDAILNELREQVDEHAFAYDRSKRKGQEIALAMNQEKMDVLVMNPTGIIGPFDFQPSKAGQMMIDLLSGRLSFVIQGGFDFCDCRDVANGIVNALTQGSPGECYVLSGKWCSLEEIVSMLSDSSGRRIRVFSVPPFLAKAGLPIARLLGWIGNKEPLYTNEALAAICTGNKCTSSAKAMRDLNYRARPLHETLRDTFQWFRESGYLGKD